jgi:alanyl-tRNA synthetase
MNSTEIRQKFLDFFESKGHKIVPSAPIVVKNDPTLMFTNAGMNQFKDYFLGNKAASDKRVANTQKCLRVSGKHNDLEEVGVDTYHHTMFEMLGNWSFGDYFKKEAIEWAWELLTEVYQLDKNRLYVTVFEGSKEDNLEFDTESYDYWEKYIDKDRILRGNKKDNFWEMGDTGPCGPCSEIHYDLRPDMERFEVDGKTLVNNDHPQVIEIWNNVFMQYNRKADGSLENLPDKHVDTGMGFERLVRAIHGKNSNYDTDIFLDTINELERISGKSYGETEKTDIAFRVIADHIRAISFTIADGQLPSNNGAGYVIRRILRRAIRYGYSTLGFKQAEIYKLVMPLAAKFEKVFPELYEQREFVSKVILEEEKTFLKTLESGLNEFENFSIEISEAFKKIQLQIPDYSEPLKALAEATKNFSKNYEQTMLPVKEAMIKFGKDASKLSEVMQNLKLPISGSMAFNLYDEKGFPLDLTKLIASEKGFTVDEKGFEEELLKQKTRSRKDAEKTTGDWNVIEEDDDQQFIGYDFTEATLKICRYRTVNAKGKDSYQAVFSITPFYAESGGQVGDTGILIGLENEEKVKVLDTTKENNLIIHTLEKLPANLTQKFEAKVDKSRRQDITKNHSATHLLHAALKEVLGNHIAQKGSLVEPERLRFDFSHFAKISDDELAKISKIVKNKIIENIALDEKRDVPIEIAKGMGATALFGEKYGDTVRVIIFDQNFSMELCGGTHVKNTGEIGAMIITTETAVAAGVRRIEAITGAKADEYIAQKLEVLEHVKSALSNPADVLKTINQLVADNHALKKQLETYEVEKTASLKTDLKQKITNINGLNYLTQTVDIANADRLKDLCFQLKNETENLFAVLGCIINDKPLLSVTISENLVTEKGWNAGQLIRDWAKEIDGGGGGQPFFATAGGKKKEGLNGALELARKFVLA